MLYAAARKRGLGQVLIVTCCEAVGIAKDQTQAVSYKAMDISRSLIQNTSNLSHLNVKQAGKTNNYFRNYLPRLPSHHHRSDPP